YRASQLTPGGKSAVREVAVKLLHATHANDTQQRHRLEREYKAMSSITHASVLSVYEFASDPKYGAFIAMEYVRGVDLETWLANHDLDHREVIKVGESLLGALAAAHAKGLTHRDVKPSNILRDQDGCIRLI